jgi:hypothetical protein
MAKILTYGTCINWQIVETEDGKHALRCSSTDYEIPVETDAQGGLIIPTVEGLGFETEEDSSSATA